MVIGQKHHDGQFLHKLGVGQKFEGKKTYPRRKDEDESQRNSRTVKDTLVTLGVATAGKKEITLMVIWCFLKQLMQIEMI